MPPIIDCSQQLEAQITPFHIVSSNLFFSLLFSESICIACILKRQPGCFPDVLKRRFNSKENESLTPEGSEQCLSEEHIFVVDMSVCAMFARLFKSQQQEAVRQVTAGAMSPVCPFPSCTTFPAPSVRM